MKVGLVGSSSVARSLPFNAERTVNLYAVLDERGSEVAALYGTPGLSLFATAGSGPVRGTFTSANDRAFCVSANTVYEVFSDGSVSSRGTINTSTGAVTIAENSTQLCVCDGEDLYILTYATNVLAEVTDVDLPSVGMVASIDGYFVAIKNNSGQFYISALNDGTSWDALDFATAESSPDNLSAVVNAVGQIWLFGTRTTEIWTNTGDSFPFRRISGAKMEVGIASPFTGVEVDNSVFWVGRDKFGTGIVYRATGFTPQRISTNAIERLLQASGSLSELRAFSYQEDGHVFYVITGGNLETSIVYDITTGAWHERAALNVNGSFEPHIACCHMYAFNKHLVGDRRSGKIYHMSLDYYSDDGDELVAERTFTHLTEEGKRLRFNSLEIYMENGVGLQTGQGENPKILMQLSKDGARTWSDWHEALIGRVGEYQTKVCFRRLGIAEQMTFKIRITDPVKRVLIGGYLS